MPSAHFGHDLVGAGRSAYASEFVGGDRHPEAVSADENPAFDEPLRNLLSHSHRKVGVVDRLVAIGPEVDDFMAVGHKQRDQFAFDLITAMVASYSDSHT